MSSITPCLWITGDVDEVIAYYSGVFPDLHTDSLSRMPDGKVVTAEITMAGQRFQLLAGGPAAWNFNESVSFCLSCQGQAEVDRFWDYFTADGGEESQCGWLKDKFGMSWQIVPKEFEDMMGGGDPAKVQQMIDAMFTMQKLDIAALQRAYDGN
jgi:predicted 3-demethylubiquinone-9 3-methyltransferase (glyoxalase superfamily)